jgi:hypothetical protein
MDNQPIKLTEKLMVWAFETMLVASNHFNSGHSHLVEKLVQSRCEYFMLYPAIGSNIAAPIHSMVVLSNLRVFERPAVRNCRFQTNYFF